MKLKHILSVCTAGVILMMTSGALAAGDASKGKKLAKKCKTCHTLKKGGKNKLGPNLYDILGQPAAQVKGYTKYSKAMKSSGIVWDDHTFTDFIAKPKKVIKGTKMSFPGFKKATQRADLLAYFETLSSGGPSAAPAGDVKAGKLVAQKHCVVCHSFDKGGKVVFGPNLWDIAGKPAAAIPGYKYSAALKNSGLTWTDKNIAGFLADPERFLKGTTARFPGLKSAKDRADVLAYLKTFK